MEWRYIQDVQDIQDDFEYMLVKHQTVTDNPSRRIYINNIEKKTYLKEKQDIIPKLQLLKRSDHLERLEVG